ncbi:bacterial surface protein 26-residue [Candidatus Symbiothrix dinenymphae]|nr:bacterial surface protein 26-residue [Candidatus Symbiothrix dinenymphae]
MPTATQDNPTIPAVTTEPPLSRQWSRDPPIEPPVEPEPPIEPPVEPEPPIEPPVEPEPPIEPPVEPEPPIEPPIEIVDSIWIYVSNSSQTVADFYVAECGADKAVVTVVTGNPFAKVEFTYGGMIVEAASLTIDIRRAGIYTVNYSVDEVPYSLKIESRLRFEDVITMRYNNVLIVKTNSGHNFVNCEWFHNTDRGWEKLKPDGLFYSAGGARSDILDTIYEYKATLHTDDGRILHTCPRRIILIYPPAAALASPAPALKAYPNPVTGGNSITIEGIPKAVESIAVHDFAGRLLSTHPVQTEHTAHTPLQQIPMPAGNGIYFIKVGEVTLKVLVE